jgi:hypothetical protein
MNPVKLVAVFSENRKGQLSRVTGVLAETGVNIHWVDISSVDGFGVIRLLVDKTDLAYQSLKQSHLTVSLLEIVAVEVADQPGSLHEVARAFADRGLSLTNCSGFVFNHRAIIFFELEDLAGARCIASELGLHQLTEEEMLGL